MNGSLKVVQAIVLLSFAGLFFTSCGGNQSTLASTTTSGTTTVEPTPTASEPTEEEEEASATIPAGYDASQLFVTIPDSIAFQSLTSLESLYSTKCSFTSASVVNDLVCNFEVGELDLFYTGMKFQFNVPANACKYIRTEPYWYYNHEVGYGPQDIQITAAKNASGVVTTATCIVDGSAPYTCTTATPPTSGADVTFSTSDEVTVKCNYDTSDEEGGKNCCAGKYRLRTNITDSSGITVPTDESGKSWGGSLGNCTGGPGKHSWDLISGGIPSGAIERVLPNTPRTKIYKVISTSEATAGAHDNIAVANYFTRNGLHTHTGYGPQSGTTSTEPYFTTPISDRSGTKIRRANPFYSFECLDESFETNYRIQVMVQEWNTVANLQSYMATGVSGTMGADEDRTAPAFCPGIPGEDCNNVRDIDDLIMDEPLNGTYDMSNSSFRSDFFPRADAN